VSVGFTSEIMHEFETSPYLNRAVVAKEEVSQCINSLAAIPPRVGPRPQSFICVDHLGHRLKNLCSVQLRIPEVRVVIMLGRVEHNDGMGKNGLVGRCLVGFCRPTYQFLKTLLDNPAK